MWATSVSILSDILYFNIYILLETLWIVERPTVLKRLMGVVIERQEVRTVAVVVIEKQVVLFLLSKLPVLYICFEHKFNPVGRVR
jgi:hypothetical protein